jgi:GT2 family glycosyltransferase
MILLIHNNKRIILATRNSKTLSFKSNFFVETLFYFAILYPNEIVCWIHEDLEPYLNVNEIVNLLGSNDVILHFNPNQSAYLNPDIGFINNSSLFKIPKTVRHLNWQISIAIGVTNTNILIKLKHIVQNKKVNPHFFLHSLGFKYIMNGLFCYHEPKLITKTFTINQAIQSQFELYRFVKQNYKFQWLFLLFFNQIIYKRYFQILPFLNALFYKRLKMDNKLAFNCSKIDKSFEELPSIDVVIPTIGRKNSLYNVLIDLKKQSILPQKVIIVEQNSLLDSTSELDYLKTQDWPFLIDHIFTHQTGACNARNIALSKVTSDWVFLNDDDNSFEYNLIDNVLQFVIAKQIEVIMTAYPQINESIYYDKIHQTTIFGSGNSFIKSNLLKHVTFDMNYEFSYGEDYDFGMQLRNIGKDIICIPSVVITHLKLPSGGFRTKSALPWENQEVLPNPSPTIMLNQLKYKTNEQLKGYKTIYYLNRIKSLSFLKWTSEFKLVNKQWKASLIWANKLLQND